MRDHRNPLRQARPLSRMSRVTEPISTESTATVKKQRQHKRKSSQPPPSTEMTVSASLTAEDNPFFSGALDKTTITKISELRPDVIDYAPVLNAASAAGASIDPFFAGALEQQAARKIPALHLSSPIIAPVPLRKASSRQVSPISASGSSGVDEQTSSKLSLDPARTDGLMKRRGKG